MKRTALIAATAAALVLGATACTAQPATESTASASAATTIAAAATPSATTPATDAGQAWADQMMQTWFAVEGARSIRGFSGDPAFIESWRSGAPGEVILTVNPRVMESDQAYGLDRGASLRGIADVMMAQVMEREPSLQKITAVTSDGAESETTTRAQVQPVGAP